MKNPFPKDFLWGASTSSHQVEGGNYNQWTVWELAHANELARTAEKRLSWLPDWEKFKPQAQNPENYVSGKAVDHYRRFAEDFDIVKKLNLNSFRFGIEWSRVEPHEGVWDKAAIDHYHNYIDELKKRGIEPVLNLWHWTHPVWFDEKGGFVKSANVGHYLRFVSKMAEEFKDEVKFVITLNEPNVYTLASYVVGEWPPQAKSPIKALRVYWNLSKAHRYAYVILKRIDPNFKVGVALSMMEAKPKHDKLVDKVVASTADYVWNRWFLNRIKRKQDFVGVNYYATNYFSGFKLSNPNKPTNDRGWYMEPKSIETVLRQTWGKYNKPILITENGVADDEDQYRKWWLKETMQALMRVQNDGIGLIGYMHWSLLDNFEWDSGWWPKFGLVEVDRKNGMKRTIRPSAKWWAEQLKIIQNK